MFDGSGEAMNGAGPFEVEGRVVVVTGGGGLLGRRYVAGLSAAGAHAVVADINADLAEAAAGEATGARALAVPTDVSDPASVTALRDRTLSEFGRVDGLVNNAAIDPKFDDNHAGRHQTSFEAYPLEAWNRSLAVNVTGALLSAQAFAPAMLERDGGVIVNVASMYGVVGPDQRLYDPGDGSERGYKPPDYTVTKAALVGFTRYLAAYYAGRPIRVNALTLGGVENGHDAGFLERYAARSPMGRMAQPDEYVGALLFLLSDASSYMTGSSLVVDGGWTAW